MLSDVAVVGLELVPVAVVTWGVEAKSAVVSVVGAFDAVEFAVEEFVAV